MPNSESLQLELQRAFKDYPDFPKPGILFKDICPVLLDPKLFKRVVQEICSHAQDCGANKIIGIESRGFILGAPVALTLGLPFVPARKKGKLPGALLSQSYALEYGTDTVEIQKSSVGPDDRCLVVDDVIATGGTAAAVGQCVAQFGEHSDSIAGYSFVLEIDFLKGAEFLQSKSPHAKIYSMLQFK